VGQHTLTANFTPTDTTDYTTATATVTLTVTPATPSITVTSSANPIFLTYSVTFTASLPSYASSETGTMTFYDGSTEIGTASVSGGSASITTSSLTSGAHSITAVYSGDANYGQGTSSAFTETIQDFTLTFAANTSGSVTVPAGGVAVYSLTVTPVNGSTLPEDVTLTASNLPLDMKAEFSSITIAAGSPATAFTLDVALPGKSANERPRTPFGRGALPVALGAILLPWASRLRKAGSRFVRFVLLAVLTAACAMGTSSCGSSGFNPQNFTLTVTASSGALSHSITPKLTVD